MYQNLVRIVLFWLVRSDGRHFVTDSDPKIYR